MFPQTSRPGAPPTNPSLYSYTHAAYNQYAQHDQNSNLQLYTAAAGFSPEFGAAPPGWTPHSWSQFPGSCRSNYDWSVEPPHPPPTTTPTSDSAAVSPQSPGGSHQTGAGQFSGARESGGGQSPSPASDYTVPAPIISSSTHYKPSLSPAPLLQQYKQEPPSSSDLGLPSSPSVSAGAPPNISLGSSLDDECPSPSPLGSSRPQPARSPFEWMKKPSHSSPPASNDPNGELLLFSIFSSVESCYAWMCLMFPVKVEGKLVKLVHNAGEI